MGRWEWEKGQLARKNYKAFSWREWEGWATTERRGGHPHIAPHPLRAWQARYPYRSLLGHFISAGSQATHSSPCEPEPALCMKHGIFHVKQTNKQNPNPQGILCTLTLQSHWPRVVNLDSLPGVNLNRLEWRGHPLFWPTHLLSS